jgi:hypothetical protein
MIGLTTRDLSYSQLRGNLYIDLSERKGGREFKKDDISQEFETRNVCISEPNCSETS